MRSSLPAWPESGGRAAEVFGPEWRGGRSLTTPVLGSDRIATLSHCAPLCNTIWPQMGHDPSDGIATRPAGIGGNGLLEPCSRPRPGHRRSERAAGAWICKRRCRRRRSERAERARPRCAISAARIISRTEGTSTSATTSWIFGAARAARSSIRRRASRRSDDRLLVRAGRPGASRSDASARGRTPASPASAGAGHAVAQGARSPRAAAFRTRSRRPRPPARAASGPRWRPSRSRPGHAGGLRPAAVPTAKQVERVRQRGPSRARRRRAARSSSASGATNPAAGSASVDDDAPAARAPPARRAAASDGADGRSADLCPRAPRATGTRSASPARSRRSGSRATARPPRRPQRARPPVRSPAASCEARRAPPPLPASSQSAAAAEQHRDRDQCAALIGRRGAAPHASSIRESRRIAAKPRELESGRDAEQRGGGAVGRAAPPTNPGSISSANSAAPVGMATTSSPVNRACAVAERASAATRSRSAEDGREASEQARRDRHRRAAGRGARRRTSRPASSAGEPGAPPSASAVDAPSSRSARTRASSAAGRPFDRGRGGGERAPARTARPRGRRRPLSRSAAARARPRAGSAPGGGADAQAAAPGPASARNGAGPGRRPGTPQAAAPTVPSAASRRRSASVGAYPSRPARRSGSTASASQRPSAGLAMTASRTATAADPARGGAPGRPGRRRGPLAHRRPHLRGPPTPPAAETTSPTSTTRRAPSASRARWTTSSIPRRTCSRIASCGRPMPGHQRQGLEPAKGVVGRVGVHGRERAVVPRVERGQQIEGLGPAHLADHDPVRAHPERVPQEVADRHLSPALDARRAALEPDHVRLAQAELGRVLDRDHALRRRRCRPTAR